MVQKVTIVGSGPAGLTAAIYAARAHLQPILYTGLQSGGQLTTTTKVENFPGFADGVMGPELMENCLKQAKNMGCKIFHESIIRVDFSKQPLKLWSEEQQIETQTVIIATGATAKTLNLPNQEKLMGHGLSTCATCDGFFYRNKRVAVVGGGDSAMEEAHYLANFCSKVFLIHRRDHFRASAAMIDKAKKRSNIALYTPCEVMETISDSKGLVGIQAKNLSTNVVEQLDVEGLFMAIGHTPNSDFFKDYVDIDSLGYIQTFDHTCTRTPGVFAAGDIADPVFRQAITSAGMGCQAAVQAQKFIERPQDF